MEKEISKTLKGKSLTTSTTADIDQLMRQDSLWIQLVDSGQFDREKAVMSLRTKEADIAALKVNTPAGAFDSFAPTLATIRKYQGEHKMQGVLMYLIAQASNALNIGKNMTPEQMRNAAQDIYSEYYFLNIAEIKLAFKRGVRGDYGKIYDRFDVSVLCDWLSKYMQERNEQLNRPESEEAHEIRKALVWHPEAMKKLADLAHSIQVRELKAREEKATFKHCRSIEEYCKLKEIDYDKYAKELYQKWQSEFEQEQFDDKEIFMLFRYNQHLLELNENTVK